MGMSGSLEDSGGVIGMECDEIALRLVVAIVEKMPITRADASPKSTGEAVGELYVTALQKVVSGLKEAGLQKSA